MSKPVWRKAGRLLFASVLLLVLSAGPASADQGEEARVIVGGSFTLRSGEVLGQDLVALGADVTLEEDSLVNGDVALFGGSLTLGGMVNGDVVGIGGRLVLENDSLINGDLVALCDLRRDPGSQVRGNTVHSSNVNWQVLQRLREVGGLRELPLSLPLSRSASGWKGSGYQALRFIMTTLALMAVGVLVAVFAPRQAERVARTMIKAAPPALGFGLLTPAVVGLATPLLIVICVGIPVAIALWLVLSLAALFGWLTAGLLVGRQVFQACKAENTPPVLEIAAGVALLSFLSVIPWAGPLFTFLVTCWGLGAVILSRCGTVPYPRPVLVSSPSQPSAVDVPEAAQTGDSGLDDHEEKG